MNIEAKPGSELATRSSYENFVIELAEGMKVDENVFLPKKEGEFDYEDIFSWIRAVDFRNGKPPKIERTIKEDRGIKTLELKTQELDEITDENKKLSSESQLYAMAVTEAKMAVVAELAEDTYPAVRYQINEIRREMQKVRQEIFGVEDKEKSVKEILDRMVRSKKIQAATALVIAAMILTACSNPTQINASEIVNPTRPVAAEVTETPIFTQEAEQTPTAEWTATPEQPYNEISIEGFTGVKPDFLLNGNLEVNKEMGEKFYTEFLDALAKNNENQDYMVGILGQNPDGAKLMDYLRNNDYILPAGLNLPYRYQPEHVRLGRNPIKEEIKLDTIKGVAFGATEWNSNAAGIVDYVNALKTYGSLISTGDDSFQYLGWAIDVRDGRLVLVAGSKNLYSSNILESWEDNIIGGGDGGFNFDRDAKVVLGEWLQMIKILKKYNDRIGNVWTYVVPFSPLCGVQDTSGVCDTDVVEFLGGSAESMFDTVNR